MRKKLFPPTMFNFIEKLNNVYDIELKLIEVNERYFQDLGKEILFPELLNKTKFKNECIAFLKGLDFSLIENKYGILWYLPFSKEVHSLELKHITLNQTDTAPIYIVIENIKFENQALAIENGDICSLPVVAKIVNNEIISQKLLVDTKKIDYLVISLYIINEEGEYVKSNTQIKQLSIELE